MNKKENEAKYFVFAAQDEINTIKVLFEDETLWLTQQLIADLFQTSRTNVVEHIRHIYQEEELVQDATCRKIRQVQKEGNRSVYCCPCIKRNIPAKRSQFYTEKSFFKKVFRTCEEESFFQIADSGRKGDPSANFRKTS